MLSTTTLSSDSTVKSGCQEPGELLMVSASRQMAPPMVTWPVYRTVLRWGGVMHLLSSSGASYLPGGARARC
jgi:hypothetical protein